MLSLWLGVDLFQICMERWVIQSSQKDAEELQHWRLAFPYFRDHSDNRKKKIFTKREFTSLENGGSDWINVCKNKINSWSAEMTQWMKNLMHKTDDFRKDSQHLQKPNLAAFMSEDRKKGRGCWLASETEWMSSRLSGRGRPCLKK